MNIRRISQFTISGLSLLGICLTAASTGQAQWVQSGSNMYYTKGNISVGTTTPFGQFTIGNYTLGSPYGSFIFNQGAFTLKGLKNSNYFPYLEFRDENNARASYLGWGSKSGKYLDWQFENGYNLAIKGGNVAIGSSNPVEKLDVNGNLVLRNSSNVGNAGASIHFTSYETANLGPKIRSALEFASGTASRSKLILSSYWNGYKDELTLMNGNVGIGTTNPTSTLHIKGINHLISLEAQNAANISGLNMFRFDENARMHAWKFWHMNQDYGKNSLQLWEYKQDGTGKDCGGNPSDGAMCGVRVRISEGGNVAIYGKLEATEVKISNSPAADFVFEPDYQLPSLSEVEQRVKADKHLPGIPSAKEIEANGGVSVGDMQAKQLQKIEELTLYMIEMNKQLSALQQENARLNAEVLKLQQARQ